MWTDFLRSSQESQTSIIFSQNQYFLSFRHSFRERARAREEARAMTGFREQTREIPRNLVISRAVSQLRNFKKDISKIIMIKKTGYVTRITRNDGDGNFSMLPEDKKKRQNFAMAVTTALWDFYFIFFYSLLLSKCSKITACHMSTLLAATTMTLIISRHWEHFWEFTKKEK